MNLAGIASLLLCSVLMHILERYKNLCNLGFGKLRYNEYRNSVIMRTASRTSWAELLQIDSYYMEKTMTKVLFRPNANVHSNKYQSFTKTSEVKKQFSKFHSLLRNNKHRRMLISCSLVIDDNNLYNDCTISPASTPPPSRQDLHHSKWTQCEHNIHNSIQN